MEWRAFLKKFYEEKHKKNPDYKFSQAMKDAAGPYHRQQRGGGGHMVPTHHKKGERSRRRQTRRRMQKGRSRKH